MVLQAQGVRDFLQEPVTQRSLEQFDMVLLSLEGEIGACENLPNIVCLVKNLISAQRNLRQAGPRLETFASRVSRVIDTILDLTKVAPVATAIIAARNIGASTVTIQGKRFNSY